MNNYTTDTSRVDRKTSSELAQRTKVREHKRDSQFDVSTLEVAKVYNYQTRFTPLSTVTPLSVEGIKHVALIAAGMSAEREVSLSSAQGISKALVGLGYRVTLIDMGADIAQILAELKPDVVYNSLHGTYGEDGCLPGLLNIMHIPYTHSGLLASALAFSKEKSKEVFRANGIKVAESIIVSKQDMVKTDPLPRPYVIKPLTQGSSIGVIPVFVEDDFNFSDYDFPYGEQVLVEKYIKGREMQVAVLNGKALGGLEIKLLKNKRFYDYETKYTDGFAEHLLPAPLPATLYQQLLIEAEKAYQSMGCKGMARVEFIYEPETEEFFILEVNTHPGMTPLSICPEIAAHSGISFSSLIQEILNTAAFE